MKKKKLLIRLLAFALTFLIALGVIVPLVYATELTVDEYPTQEVYDETEPTKTLPEGYEYRKTNDVWTVVRKNGNSQNAFILDGLPVDGFDGSYVNVFVGNLDTHEVFQYELINDYGFIKTIDLKDGYYVIFSGDYAWSDSKGNAYSVNGGSYQYFYIGNNYNEKTFPVKFQRPDNGFIRLSLGDCKESDVKIEYNQRLIIDTELIKYPEGAKLERINPENNEKQKNIKKEEPNKKNNFNFIKSLFSSLSRSLLLIIGVVVCYMALSIIKKKKNEDMETQSNNDKCDDKHIL